MLCTSALEFGFVEHFALVTYLLFELREHDRAKYVGISRVRWRDLLSPLLSNRRNDATPDDAWMGLFSDNQ